LQHFDAVADAPNGVQKLRELILQLAVRGKLVPQDPGDEPASVLLDRARAVKGDLIRRKQVRERGFSPIGEEEALFPLPEGWMWARLDDVGYELGQKVPDRLFTYVDVSSVDNRRGSISDQVQVLDPQDAPSRARKLISPGTVIYSTVRPYLLNIAVIDKEFDPEPIVSTAFAVLHPFAGIEARYLFHYLRSAPFIEYVEAQMTGMAYPAINDGKFYSGPVPVPPIAEQRRIVEKVNQLMALCDELEERQHRRVEARVRLNRASLHHLTAATDDTQLAEHWRRIRDNFHRLYDAPETVTELRQAILQLAVRGKLVPQNPSDEPASVLLERIEAEKQRLYTEVKIGKASKPSPVEPDEVPFEIPNSWEWTRLDTLSAVIEYGTSQRASSIPDGVPVIRMNNVQAGAVLTDDLKYVPADISDLPRLLLNKGDILFNRTNSFELVGKSGIFQGDSGKFTFASYLIRLRCWPGVVPEYVNLVLNAPFFRSSQIEPEITQQTGQANFNGSKLRRTLLLLPPVDEQRRIVEKVNQLMALCDGLEAKLTRSRTKAEKLASAVVHHLTAA
jgi:type I restriction enzyme S subunit